VHSLKECGSSCRWQISRLRREGPARSGSWSQRRDRLCGPGAARKFGRLASARNADAGPGGRCRDRDVPGQCLQPCASWERTADATYSWQCGVDGGLGWDWHGDRDGRMLPSAGQGDICVVAREMGPRAVRRSPDRSCRTNAGPAPFFFFLRARAFLAASMAVGRTPLRRTCLAGARTGSWSAEVLGWDGQQRGGPEARAQGGETRRN